MADFAKYIPSPKLVETVKFKLSEEARKRLYRLYGLAEAVYYDYYAHNESKESITVTEEPEDHNGDEWTMLKSDYELIREVISGFNAFNTLTSTFATPLKTSIAPNTLVDDIKPEWPMSKPSNFMPIMKINYPNETINFGNNEGEVVLDGQF